MATSIGADGSGMCKGFASDDALRTVLLMTHDKHTRPSIIDTGQKDSYAKTKAFIIENDSGICQALVASKETLFHDFPFNRRQAQEAKRPGTMEGMEQKDRYAVTRRRRRKRHTVARRYV